METTTPSTPKKVYSKPKHKGYCRLCGRENESRYMTNVLSAAAVEKRLVETIYESCGILVESSDDLFKTVCNKCLNFVKKINLFRGECQKAQTDLKTHVTVKRCPVQSPTKSNERPAKRQTVSRPESTEEPEANMLDPIALPVDLVQDESEVQSSMTQVQSARNRLAFSSSSSTTAVPTSTHITARERERIAAAAKTEDACVFADIIMKHCPNVFGEIKRKITDNIMASCEKLCHRNNGSILHAGRQDPYGMMINFSFEKLWEEMETNIPYVIAVLNAVTGVERDKAKQCVQAKYGFLYSILMNVRWHELSLIQRLNTLCLIEGGCSKQVYFSQYVFNDTKLIITIIYFNCIIIVFLKSMIEVLTCIIHTCKQHIMSYEIDTNDNCMSK